MSHSPPHPCRVGLPSLVPRSSEALGTPDPAPPESLPCRDRLPLQRMEGRVVSRAASRKPVPRDDGRFGRGRRRGHLSCELLPSPSSFPQCRGVRTRVRGNSATSRAGWCRAGRARLGAGVRPGHPHPSRELRKGHLPGQGTLVRFLVIKLGRKKVTPTGRSGCRDSAGT